VFHDQKHWPSQAMLGLHPLSLLHSSSQSAGKQWFFPMSFKIWFWFEWLHQGWIQIQFLEQLRDISRLENNTWSSNLLKSSERMVQGRQLSSIAWSPSMCVASITSLSINVGLFWVDVQTPANRNMYVAKQSINILSDLMWWWMLRPYLGLPELLPFSLQ